MVQDAIRASMKSWAIDIAVFQLSSMASMAAGGNERFFGSKHCRGTKTASPSNERAFRTEHAEENRSQICFHVNFSTIPYSKAAAEVRKQRESTSAALPSPCQRS